MSGPPSPADFPPGYLEANKGPQVTRIIIAFPIVATIIVLLRIYTRFRIVQNSSWDDYTIIGALVFSIATSICQGFQVHNGMGRHIAALTMDQGINSLKALFASIMMYNFGLTLTKLSIILQYLRIAVEKPTRKACWFLFWLTIANCFQTFITGIFTCYPVPKFWDDRIPGGCVNKPALWYANAAINILQDIYLIALPLFILRTMILPKREKISLALILGLGGFASCASVFRLHALYLVAISTDITWDNPGTATWSAMELNIGIICASLPTLRTLLAKYFPALFKSRALAAYQNRRDGYQISSSAANRKSFFANGYGHNSSGSRAAPDGTIIVRHEIDVERGSADPIVDGNCVILDERVSPTASERKDNTFFNSDSDADSQKRDYEKDIEVKRPPIAFRR